MNRDEIKGICDAAMLRFDSAVLESLDVIGKMMEEVVNSNLCVPREGRVPEGECVLRSDEVKQEYGRDEMLCGAVRRKGQFVVVPAVIKSESEKSKQTI